MTESSLGQRWADTVRARGGWAIKVPASVALAGIPDWAAVEQATGYRCVEAKLAQVLHAVHAYHPNQLRLSQRMYLDAVGRHGGIATVVVLAPESFVELPWPSCLKPLSWPAFWRVSMEYACPPRR